MGKPAFKISKNLKDTAKIAKEFLVEVINKKNHRAEEALVIGLSGDLGAGKTAFVKAAAKQLGVKGKVSSPTFVIMKKYPIKHDKYKFLFHLDAYRLKNKKELLLLGWDEVVGDRENLIFIEWPENVPGALPLSAKKIFISSEEGKERRFLAK